MTTHSQNQGIGALTDGHSMQIRVQILDRETLIAESLAICLNADRRFVATALPLVVLQQNMTVAVGPTLISRTQFQENDVFILRGAIDQGSPVLLCASEVMKQHPKAKIVFIVPNLSSHDIDFALEFGVNGVLDERVGIATLSNIIALVHSGDLYVPKDYVLKRVRDSMGIITH